MSKLRFRFEKLGRARYISHLDLMRTFQRAFMRAGLYIKHSEGFNPHPHMSIVLPLRLGCESLCEYLDAELIEPGQDMPRRLSEVLPEGIRVTSVHQPEMKPGEVKYTRCRISLHYDDGADRSAQAAELLSGPCVEIMKKTKRGEGILNIAPHIKLLSAADNELELILSAFEPTVNPSDVVGALKPDYAACCRLEIYNGSMEKFR